jgi:hypothetical protein
MRFATAALGCFIATLAFARADPTASQLDALLRRVRDAEGAPYAIHLRGIADEDAPDGTRVTIATDTQGARSWVRRCAGEVCSGTYVDGDRTWLTNVNSTAVPAEREDARRVTLRAIENAAFADPSFSARGGRVAPRPRLLLRDGRIVARVAVTAPGGTALDALIDEKTGLVAGARGDDIEVLFSDVRAVGDVHVPFEMKSGERVERFRERTVVAEPLEPPDGLQPRFPRGPQTAPFADGDRPGTMPVVTCVMREERVPCLIDTGNSGMSISLELAERLGLEPLPDSFRISGLGAYDTGIVKAPEVRIGNVTYPAAYYAVLHDVHPYGYDVVLGTDALAHAAVTIDYAAKRVTFAPERAVRPDGGGVDVAFENFLPIVRANLGSVPARLAIDTGDESTINLSADFSRAHPGIFTQTATAHVGGIGGAAEESIGTIARADIGDYALIGVPIAATSRALPTADGHVGGGALAHFTVLFDYAHGRVGLTPKRGDASVVSSGESPATL